MGWEEVNQACRHKKVKRMRLVSKYKSRMKTIRDPRLAFEKHVNNAAKHESMDQLGLALREWREAARIRPRDANVRRELERLFNILSPPSLAPEPIPSERFASIFNLSVRYWDRNMASAALKEVFDQRVRSNIM